MGGQDSKTSKWCDKISRKNDDAVDDADDAVDDDAVDDEAVDDEVVDNDDGDGDGDNVDGDAVDNEAVDDEVVDDGAAAEELDKEGGIPDSGEEVDAAGADEDAADEDAADEDAADEDAADEDKDADKDAADEDAAGADDAGEDVVGAGEDAMDVATRAAIRTAGGEAPSAEVVADARARASEMLTTMSSDDEAGLKDLQNLTLSMGLPSTRSMFQFMIENSKLRGVAKKDAIQAVADFSPVSESGCMKVDFFNQARGAPDIAYLVLHKCPRDHDLEAQLNKLKPHVLAEKWAEVTRSLSMLIYIGRSVYGQIARANLGLIRDIHGAAADDPCTDYLDLKVDVENTTLYLDASWPSRIGIYIRLGAEVEGNKSNA
jgi:hypothetical protein